MNDPIEIVEDEDNQVEVDPSFLHVSEDPTTHIPPRDYIAYLAYRQVGGKGQYETLLIVKDEYHILSPEEKEFLTNYFTINKLYEYKSFFEQDKPVGLTVSTYIVHPKYFMIKEDDQMEEDDLNVEDDKIGKPSRFRNLTDMIETLKQEKVLSIPTTITMDRFVEEYVNNPIPLEQQVEEYVRSTSYITYQQQVKQELSEQITSDMNHVFSPEDKIKILSTLLTNHAILLVEPTYPPYRHWEQLIDVGYRLEENKGGPTLQFVDGQLIPGRGRNNNIVSILYRIVDPDKSIIYRTTVKLSRNSSNNLLIELCLPFKPNQRGFSWNDYNQQQKIQVIGYVLEICPVNMVMGLSGCVNIFGAPSHNGHSTGRGVHEGFICETKKNFDVESIILDHQNFNRHNFITNKSTRLLLYHRLGSGKTCTAIYIADKLLEQRKIVKVYVFCTGTLRTSWLEEYCSRCGVSSDVLKNYYVFITLNYSSNIQSLDFSSSLVIVDEVHILLSYMKNGSKIGIPTYKKILDAKYLILLSGTPITSCNMLLAKVEFYFLIRLLDDTNSNKEQVNRVIDWCVLKEKRNLEDVGILEILETYLNTNLGQSIIKRCVSYFDLEQPDIQLRKHEVLILCRASNIQAQKIKHSIYKENVLMSSQTVENQEIVKLAKMRKMSRKDSNYYDSDSVLDIVLPTNYNQLREYSTKYTALIDQLYRLIRLYPHRKHLIYSNYLYSHGAFFIRDLILSLLQNKDHPLEISIFHGTLIAKQKQALINQFNEPYNNTTRIFIVTDAGSIGINLLHTNYLHITDSHYSEPKIQQLIGRIIRYNSHKGMKQDDQQVWIFRYLTYYTSSEIATQKGYHTISVDSSTKDIIQQLDKLQGIDVKLYLSGKICLDNTERYNKLLQEDNIERNK